MFAIDLATSFATFAALPFVGELGDFAILEEDLIGTSLLEPGSLSVVLAFFGELGDFFADIDFGLPSFLPIVSGILPFLGELGDLDLGLSEADLTGTLLFESGTLSAI